MEYYYEELWADIDGFEGYQVSNYGRVRSFWYMPFHGRGAKRYLGLEPHIVPQSDDGNGYLKVCLMKNGKNYMRKVHRLVAEAFIPNLDPSYYDTVDHIISGPEGKLDNSVSNLRWMSRGDNIRKAWKDGVCEGRRRQAMKPVMATDINTRETIIFPSLRSACYHLCLNEDTARHLMSKGNGSTIKSPYSEFYLEYLEGKERALVDNEWNGGLTDYDGYWR